MKKIVFLFFLIAFSIDTYSQSSKENLVVMSVVKDGFETDETKRVTNELIRIFRESNRFNLLDKYIVQKESKDGSRIFYTGIDDEIIALAKKNNVKYLVSSVVSNYENDGRRCELVLSVRVMDVEASNYIASKDISAKVGKKRANFNVNVVSPQKKRDKLFEEVIDVVSKDVRGFIKNEI